MSKFRNFVIAAAAFLMAGVMAVPSFAAVSYQRWYENQFGTAPEGTLSDWEESDDKYFSGSGVISSNVSSSGSSASSTAGPGSSAQWVQANDGTGRWWYRHTDGRCTRNNWEKINGKWYFFNGDGWMHTGWINLNGGTYFTAPDGAMVCGNYMVDGAAHNFDSTGRMVY